MTIFKNIDSKLPVMLAMNCAIFTLLLYLNDTLAFAAVYVYAAALLIVPPALFLGFWSVVVCALITGFLTEVSMPVYAGITPVFFLLASLGVFRVREKFRSFEPVGVFMLFWVVNAIMFVSFCLFLFPVGVYGFGAYMTRISVDFIVSSLFIFLFSNFLMRVYHSIFYILGMDLSIPEDV